MDILICGAYGLIGRHLTHEFEQLGHRVSKGVRLATQADEISIDYRHDIHIEDWLAKLRHFDIVINTVGILREKQKQDFATIHTQTPIALFQACRQLGIQHIIQISAFGNTQTEYFRSKHLADNALLKLYPENATIIRPSLIFSEDGLSSQFFMTLASTPIILDLHGAGTLQPIHIDDFIHIITHNITNKNDKSQIINIAGPQALSYRQLMQCYRSNLGMNQTTIISIPKWLMTICAYILGLYKNTMLDLDNWKMLQDAKQIDTTKLKYILNHKPREPKNFIAPQDTERLRNQVLQAWKRPLFITVLAFIWLYTAFISVLNYQESLNLLASCYLTGKLAWFSLLFAVGLDAILGILSISKPCAKLWHFQISLIITYSIIIAIALPQYFLHPFTPIIKNLAIIAILIVLINEESMP